MIDREPDTRNAEECDELGIFVVIGDATDARVTTEARVGRAASVVVITPTDETNVRVGLEIEELCALGVSRATAMLCPFGRHKST